MDDIREHLTEVLDAAANPAVLFSGGKDSLLLLALAHEVRPDICAIWFRTGEPSAHILRMLKEWDITTFSWNPADVYLLFGDEPTLIHEYPFGELRFPVAIDLAAGRTCSRILPPPTTYIHHNFDVLLWGAKDCDQHWLKGDGQFPPDGHQIGPARLYAPLRHLTDEEVLAAIDQLGLPYEPQPDSLPMCTACMQHSGTVFCPELQREIPSVMVDSGLAVAAFRDRFNLGGV